ncbi:MAG: TspO/MBR family protein [Nakamurella sp.]
MKMRPVLAHAAAVSAAAIAGGLLTNPTSAWYRTLAKPRWQPPAKLFGPVWSGLYATIAYAGSAVWSKSNDEQRKQWARALTVNLVLNATWSGSFFRSHNLVFAAVHASLLEASTLDLIRRARTVSAPAAAALVPYAAWGGFALALNVDIARRNSTSLGHFVDALHSKK